MPWTLLRSAHVASGAKAIASVPKGAFRVIEAAPECGPFLLWIKSQLSDSLSGSDLNCRRRGLARFLMDAILEWADLNHVDHLTLSASQDARILYESLGFTSTSDMKRDVRDSL